MRYAVIFDALKKLDFITNKKESRETKLDQLITNIHLSELLDGHKPEDELSAEALKEWQKFFSDRWLRVQHTRLDYTLNTQNATNRKCLAIAATMQEELGISRYRLLMPTLVDDVSLITQTNLKDDDVAISDFVLSDDGKHFIEVAQCLGGAVEDNVLKHTQRMAGNKAVALSALESCRVRSHSTEAKNFAQAIHIRHEFAHNANTVGGMLQCLIDGLRQGGARQDGQEMNASERANLAILNFSIMYNSLPEETREQLNALKDDNHNFAYYWNILALEQQRKVDAALHEKVLIKLSLTHQFANADLTNDNIVSILATYAMKIAEVDNKLMRIHANVATCVEITASGIESLFKQNKDKLFAMELSGDFAKYQNVSRHDQAVEDAEYWLKWRMQQYANGDPLRLSEGVAFWPLTGLSKLLHSPKVKAAIRKHEQAHCPVITKVRSGELEVSEKHGFSKEQVNAMNLAGQTALVVAIEMQREDLAKTLVDSGADVDTSEFISDTGANTAFMLACHQGMNDFIRFMLSKAKYSSKSSIPYDCKAAQLLEMNIVAAINVSAYINTRQHERNHRAIPRLSFFSRLNYSGYNKIMAANNVLVSLLNKSYRGADNLPVDTQVCARDGRLGAIVREIDRQLGYDERVDTDTINRSMHLY